MTIQIEKNIPVPAYAGSMGPPTKYPFKDMEVGDSFAVELKQTRSKTLANLQNTLNNCARQAIGPGKVATRRLPEGNGYRVWRLK